MRFLTSVRFLACILLLPFTLSAQKIVVISGTIKDQKQTLPSATVLLFSAKDSVLTKTAMTDGDGNYTFSTTSDKYYITASSVGYNKVTTAVFQLTQESAYKVAPITLAENAKQLNEVNIVSVKPVLERRADKLLFNVDASPSAAGLNALEVLKKAPGVTVDQNDQISLAGKGNVLVMIDGKESYLSSAEVSNMLRSMESSQIETVEIMTNPGSRYPANSTGGIINIKTKKSKTEGFNGNVSLGAGYNRFFSTNNSINLNYRKKSYNVFGGYGYSKRDNEQILDIQRTSLSAGERLYFDQHSIDSNLFDAQNFKIGTDFFLNSKHTVGFLIKGNFYNFNSPGSSVTSIGRSFSATDSILRTSANTKSERSNLSYNINYKGLLDTAGQEITVDADYSKFKGETDGSFVNKFYLTNGDFFSNGQIYRNQAPSNIDIKALKIDYTLPLNKKFKLDAGMKFSKVASDNNYIYENRVGNEWVNDLNQSNRFTYDERVNAGYVALNGEVAKLTFQAGLRVENTNSKGNSITTNQVTDRKYTDFFPSLMVSRNLNTDNIVSLTYSRKINRPDYQNLNPFIFYVDQYTYNEGNPNLKPEYANSIEASYTFKQKYNASLAYTNTSDVISMVLLQDSNSMFQTVRNLASEDIVSLTLNFPVTISKWWNMNNNIVGFYQQIKSPDLNGLMLNSSQYTGNLYNQNNFVISKAFNADLGLMYNTPQIEGTFKIKSMFNADAGLRYNFPSQAGNLKLGVSDVFHTQKARLASTLEGNDYTLQQYGSTTAVRLTFTYRFGKMTVKSARTRNTALEEEQKRLNGGN